MTVDDTLGLVALALLAAFYLALPSGLLDAALIWGP